MTFDVSFLQKVESTQYNADLAITEAIRGTSGEKIYPELSFKLLKGRRWSRKLSFL